jgi:SMC interacting uncharacterized protein involved in chromosome segregation
MTINVFGPPTKQEKEEMALYMLQEGKTYRQIAKECHLSFKDISKLIKGESGQLEDNGVKKVSSQVKENQAIKLFNEGKSPIEVAIETQLSTEDVLMFHQKYQQLRNLDMFNQAYNQVKGNIVPYLQLFNLMNSLGMTPEDVARQVNTLPQLQNTKLTLRNEINDLRSQKENLVNKLNLMWKEVEEHTKALQYLNNEIEKRNKELVALDNEIDEKQKFIRNLTVTKAMSE